MPIVLAGKKLSVFLFKYLYLITAYIMAGQKLNFKCSQTLSLTAEKTPTKGFLPDNSKVKCKALPTTTIKLCRPTQK